MQNNNYAFLEAFKALDKICKELFMSDKGVTAYIDRMKASPSYESSTVAQWSADLSRLISLRNTRNILSHEVGTLDKNMCDQTDIDWLNNFKTRILNQTDPLALLHKYKKERSGAKAESQSTSPFCQQSEKPSRFAIIFYSAFILIAAFIFIAIILNLPQ